MKHVIKGATHLPRIVIVLSCGSQLELSPQLLNLQIAPGFWDWRKEIKEVQGVP